MRGSSPSAMLVVEGAVRSISSPDRSRERPGEPKHYASYALQWALMREARSQGAQIHDLWGVAPPGAGPDHAWHGVGLFKKGFGGEEVMWAGTWDLVIDPAAYRLRTAAGMMRTGLRRALESPAHAPAVGT